MNRKTMLMAFSLTLLASSMSQAESQICPEVTCDIFCENGYEEDKGGCMICKCRRCAPVPCRMYCHYGYEQDKSGCDICQCADRPTTTSPECHSKTCDYACPQGYQVDGIGCKTCLCKDCPLTQCALLCEKGFKRDANGCELCECKNDQNTQNTSTCPDHNACSLPCQYGHRKDNSGCLLCECMAANVTSHCDTVCPFGIRTRSSIDGCPTECKETMCEGVICHQGEVCFHHKTCVGNCSSPTSCVQIKALGQCNVLKETGSCNSAISRWFLDPTSGQCGSFAYTGCGGNLNNFNSRQECELACVETSHPQIVHVSFEMFQQLHKVEHSEQPVTYSHLVKSLQANLTQWLEISSDFLSNIEMKAFGQETKSGLKLSFALRRDDEGSLREAVMLLANKVRNRLITIPTGPSSFLVADYNSFQVDFEPAATSNNSVIFIVCFVAGALFIISLAVAVIVCSRRRKGFTLHEET